MEAPRRVSDHRNQLAECPTVHPDDGWLYWTDIKGEQLLRYRPSAGVEIVCRNVVVGGFTVQSDGSLLLFMDEGTVGRYRDGTLSRDLVGLPDFDARFNDVVADPEGRVLCGTMPGPDQPGHLYRLDRDGSFERLLTRVQVPNGLGFSPDFEHLYFTETNNRLIHRFEYDRADGTIDGRETFADFREGPGKPDGLAVDSTGNVWSAQWGAGTVECFLPDGDRNERIELPAQYVTSVTFDTGSTLYVTTAQASEPDVDQGGNVFSVDTGFTGRAYQPSKIEV